MSFQVPDSAVSLWKAAVAIARPAFSRSVHHRGGVLQKDHRKRAHHTTTLRHVQVQRYMSYRRPQTETQKYSVCIFGLDILTDAGTLWMLADVIM